MAEGADFRSVPVVDVHGGNFKSLWPAIQNAVSTSDFVAVDLELSGLGNRRHLSAQSVADRYKHLCEVTRTRAVVAMGLSCFKQLSATDDYRQWMVQTFDINILCRENYTVEPDSLKFLVEHGFDFNKQCAKGLPYSRGNDKENEEPVSVRSLFGHLLVSKRPVVMHNALVDLVFLYESFYADLPSSFDSFVADLATMYGGDLYDTKYLAEFDIRTQASYLEYLFRSSQRQNFASCRSSRRFVSITFVSYPTKTSCVDHVRCGLPQTAFDAPVQPQRPAVELCEKYSAFGFCPVGVNCPKSHDLDHILNAEEFEVFRRSRKRRRRQRKKQAEATAEEDDMEVSSANEEDDSQKPAASSEIPSKPSSKSTSAIIDSSSRPARAWSKGGHRAGFDAFMTGFFFAWCLEQPAVHGHRSGDKEEAVTNKNFESLLTRLEQSANRVSLTGKDQPLLIVKSHFARTSVQHKAKWTKLHETK